LDLIRLWGVWLELFKVSPDKRNRSAKKAGHFTSSSGSPASILPRPGLHHQIGQFIDGKS
jgi:hypothetical protein